MLETMRDKIENVTSINRPCISRYIIDYFLLLLLTFARTRGPWNTFGMSPVQGSIGTLC